MSRAGFLAGKEADRVMDYLATMPKADTTTTPAAARKLLLDTNGRMFARGYLYDIVVKRLGCGVVRVSLKVSP